MGREIKEARSLSSAKRFRIASSVVADNQGLGMMAFWDGILLVSPFSILARGIRCASYPFTGRRAAGPARCAYEPVTTNLL